jgi:hypothetical protein
MKFFNYEDLYILAGGDSTLILKYFKESLSSGPNFIKNPRAVLNALGATDRDKAEYLGICALRSYTDYKTTGELHLVKGDLPPWVSKQVIANNPLITETETKYILNKEKI